MVRLPRFTVVVRAACLTGACLVIVIAAGAAGAVVTDSGAAASSSGPASPGAPVAAALDDVGHVDFATSGSPAAQARFLRGLAQLHNFEYESAAEEFMWAQSIDPEFAMAYWGEAMTKNHPIWMEQDTAAGRAVLLKLGATAEARLAKAPTQREKDYLRAVMVLYGDDAPVGADKTGGTDKSPGADKLPGAAAAADEAKRRRDFAYADAMAELHRKYPADVDAAAFDALAILGTAHDGRDLAIYMRSAAILEELFPANSMHPGVVHYMIHSYDDPVHAPLGLRAARLYSRIAPAAAHAQHMTSHIFLALGMWDDVIAANETATGVVNRRRAARSLPAQACGHYSSWLEYGYLQQGRRDDARKVLDACLDQVAPAAKPATAASAAAASAPAGHVCATVQTIDPDKSSAGSAAQMWGRFLLDAKLSPDELARLALAPPAVDHPAARLTGEFARGLVAARTGSLPAAREALASVHEARAAVEAMREGKEDRNGTQRGIILEDELRAAILAAEGKGVEAVALLRQAAAAEESLPMAFGPPFVDKPAHELLGELLLEMGRPAEARAAFETAVARAPNRTRSVDGLHRCAAAVPGSAPAGGQAGAPTPGR